MFEELFSASCNPNTERLIAIISMKNSNCLWHQQCRSRSARLPTRQTLPHSQVALILRTRQALDSLAMVARPDCPSPAQECFTLSPVPTQETFTSRMPSSSGLEGGLATNAQHMDAKHLLTRCSPATPGKGPATVQHSALP